MATKKDTSMFELLESHKPKNFKFAIILEEEYRKQLEDEGHNPDDWDMIKDPELLEHAIHCEYKEYDRSVIQKAKEPTCLEDGIIISKKMATKTDKKLLSVGVGRFIMDGVEYVSIRLKYEKFHIIQIFILN